MTRKFALLILSSLFLVGCATTKITGYSDPLHAESQYSSVVVLASNVGLARASTLEGGICSKFQERDVKCIPFQMLFPPTRQYTPDTVYQVLTERGYDSLIVLSSGSDNSSSEVLGYQNYASATAAGNNAYGQSSTFAIRSHSRQSAMRVTLLDVKTRETAWLGDAITAGQGSANVTDSVFNKSVINKVVATILATPHYKSGPPVPPRTLRSR